MAMWGFNKKVTRSSVTQLVPFVHYGLATVLPCRTLHRIASAEGRFTVRFRRGLAALADVFQVIAGIAARHRKDRESSKQQTRENGRYTFHGLLLG